MFSLIKKQNGQTMLEAAIVLPLIVFVMFAIIVYGFALNSKIAVITAAREGARTYAVYKNENLMRDSVEKQLKTAIPMSSSKFAQSFNKYSDIQYSVDPITKCVTVTVTFRQPTYIPGLMRLLGGGNIGNYFNLKGSAVFKLEP
ncbi:hypothetical protein AN618_23480 [Fervidicola ferrireducens]|uniref:TadE-like domain-containing protein n=1 Tax=Fervidicola ferrireducens TaxID=520764 RepID=A0A140L177_9FIRM|nr:TadE family protein [Fervidicola ferrireducens]KXG74302.1 hypothetical protein AN618_23480 [Fervidicola ferrireducens]